MSKKQRSRDHHRSRPLQYSKRKIQDSDSSRADQFSVAGAAAGLGKLRAGIILDPSAHVPAGYVAVTISVAFLHDVAGAWPYLVIVAADDADLARQHLGRLLEQVAPQVEEHIRQVVSQ